MAKFLNGAKVPHRKDTQGSGTNVMPIPDTVRILMSQHIGAPCSPTVKKGDTVKVGQIVGDCEAKICAPIHSSVSGTVTGTEDILVPNGSRVTAVVIETDKEQTLFEEIAPPTINSHSDFVTAIRNSGIVGLGGAGFPTHVKFDPPNLDQVHTLVINAAECEPYITSDNQTILEDTEDLLKGINALLNNLDLDWCYIAIEDNKPEAIEVLNKMAAEHTKIRIKVLPAIYPQGAEKVTIYHTLDGLVVPEGKLPADVGVIVSNVTTIAEVGRYLETGIPLTNKRVTVSGSAISQPQNVMAPIGTSIKDIVEFCGGYKGTPAKILMGGPMMGIAVPTDEYPLIKNNNAFVIFDRSEATRYQETPCISCGRCLRACPMNLMPSNLKEATEVKDIDLLRDLKVNLCIECGCCAYVCPARQELVQSHRTAKGLVRQDDAKKAAKAAK